ncbi:MAG: glutathione peroxidase [Rhodospirillales bacterium]|nr:glutathione peroxidase [Rhodospirillales bacterium]
MAKARVSPHPDPLPGERGEGGTRGSGRVRRLLVILLAVAWVLLAPLRDVGAAGSAHDFRFTAIEGGELSLARFKGKAVLVVNTASMCGYTPQYAGLQNLWARYRERGLVVLGVPSNDFGGQEPGTEKEIKQFCDTAFGIDFPMTTKEKVIGANAHPFYSWAAKELGGESVPKWNFHKYLIAPDGRLVRFFPTRMPPDAPELIGAIEAALPR